MVLNSNLLNNDNLNNIIAFLDTNNVVKLSLVNKHLRNEYNILSNNMWYNIGCNTYSKHYMSNYVYSRLEFNSIMNKHDYWFNIIKSKYFNKKHFWNMTSIEQNDYNNYL